MGVTVWPFVKRDGCTCFNIQIFFSAASPVFSPTTYNIQVGLNTTAGTILTTLSASDSDNDTLTYAISNTNGSIYFDVDTSTGSPNLVLVNLLDVEYGNIQWSFEVTATDGANIGKLLTYLFPW